jgi:hypothetical protein
MDVDDLGMKPESGIQEPDQGVRDRFEVLSLRVSQRHDPYAIELRDVLRAIGPPPDDGKLILGSALLQPWDELLAVHLDAPANMGDASETKNTDLHDGPRSGCY